MKAIREQQPLTQATITNDPIIDRILQNRGIESNDDIDYKLSSIHPPMAMKDMDKASDIIISHILSGSRILILGDFDCDGATASSIAWEGLAMCGAKNVEYMVPDRAIHGYGTTPSIVAEAAKLSPDLIITVDNGISSFEGAKAVKNLAKPCQLVITDHHLPPDEGLPEADAIVNPNQHGCDFPSKNTAGCGVIFYVIAAVVSKMRQQKLFEKLGIEEPDIRSLLDLVALGTIADLVKLDKNNRILVNAGLKIINNGSARPGINALLDISKKQIGEVVSADLAFYVGPRVNAAGRIDDMSIGIRCLTSKDEKSATDYAKQLHEFNVKRRDIEAEMVEEASRSIEDVESQNYGVCLHDPNWHEGVVGILASRVKEKLNRPVICFTDTKGAKESRARYEAATDEDEKAAAFEALMNEEIKGSARSVPGVHLKHLLDLISKKRPELLEKFGGHAMAAGLSIKYQHLEQFSSIFDHLVRKKLTAEMIAGEVIVDIENLPGSAMTLDMANKIQGLGPWGQGFEAPVFAATFDIEDHRVLGGKHLKLKLRPKDSIESIDAISFNCVDGDEVDLPSEIRTCFKLDINKFRGQTNLQLMIDYLDLDGPDQALENSQEAAIKPVDIKGLSSNEKSKGEKRTQRNQPAVDDHSPYPKIQIAQEPIF